MTEIQAQTRRELITELLRTRPEIHPTGICDALADHDIDLTPGEVIDELEAVHQSLPDAETMYIAPAECRDCGFDDWDTLLNIPSRCPNSDCRSEWIAEPYFTIE